MKSLNKFLHFKFIRSHLHDAFPLIYINFMQLLLFIYLAITKLHSFHSLCGSAPTPWCVRLCPFAVMLCLSNCLCGCMCVCVWVCVHCASALSLQNIWVTFVVAAQFRTRQLFCWRAGNLIFYWLDSGQWPTQCVWGWGHNLSTHCLRHMFDVYKFNLIYLNNYVPAFAKQRKIASDKARTMAVMRTKGGHWISFNDDCCNVAANATNTHWHTDTHSHTAWRRRRDQNRI